MLKPGSFYIHIPFCIHRCVYCAFCSGISPDEGLVSAYIESLCREIELQAHIQEPVAPLQTLYLGGGTPSLLSRAQLARLMDCVHTSFPLSEDAEISLEANPEDVSPDLARHWHDVGINRVSLGLQSMEDPILRLLERRNSRATNLKAPYMIRQAGISNISGDIILNIPGMDLKHSLLPMLDLGLTHISAYTLSIEEGAELYRREQAGSFQALSEDEAMDEYWQAVDMMAGAGYTQYEISNFARSGHTQSRHNLNYWDYGPYYGAGLGASGTWWKQGQLIRYKNTEDMELYLQGLGKEQLPVLDEEILDQVTQVREYLMLNLRKTSGVDASRFRKRFNRGLFSVLPHSSLDSLREFLEWDDYWLRFNKKGQELANPLTSEIWELLQTKGLPE